jgi:hypothetical protein
MQLGLVLLVAIITASACHRVQPLADSSPSAEALAEAVLTAIEKGDVDALHALALSKTEFEEHVWPELPAAQPKRNLSVGYVWGDLSVKSNLTLTKTLSAHGGKRYTLQSMRFLGRTTPYASYVVHRESELTVRDENGKERRLRLFGSVLEKQGRYKVFSYVVSD